MLVAGMKMVCATLEWARDTGTVMEERPGGEVLDFENFIRGHYNEVLAYLLSRTRNLQVAQDLAQETFLQAYRSRGSYDPGRGGGLQWLMGIARNVSAYAARRQSAKARKAPLLEKIAEEAWSDRPGEGVEDARLAALRRCLGTLTERSRRIIELLYESGLTYAQVAERLGMGTGAVKVAAFRARQALLDCMRRRADADKGPP